jgi:hypothetical protein
LERCIEEYVLRFSQVLNIENKKILIEVADKYVEHSLFPEAQSIYESLSFDEKMSSKNYLECLKKTQKWVLLDTFCIEMLRINPTNPKAKAYLIIAAFHDYLESENAILILKEQYKNPNFHSLVISRILDVVMSLKESFILNFEITPYVGAIYFII